MLYLLSNIPADHAELLLVTLDLISAVAAHAGQNAMTGESCFSTLFVFPSLKNLGAWHVRLAPLPGARILVLRVPACRLRHPRGAIQSL